MDIRENCGYEKQVNFYTCVNGQHYVLGQPERLNPEALNLNDGFYPPPWNINEHPEKTEGWIEFQKAMRKDPQYYL